MIIVILEVTETICNVTVLYSQCQLEGSTKHNVLSANKCLVMNICNVKTYCTIQPLPVGGKH